MNNIKRWALTLAASVAAVFSAQAQFSSDFNSSAPPGTRSDGTARVEGGFLKLIDATQAGQQGNFYIDGIASGGAISGFTADFKMYLFGSTCCGNGALPADGLSFNVNADGTGGNPAEEGSGSGLAITFDTWDNSAAADGSDVGISVKWKGATVGHFVQQTSQSIPPGAADAAAAEKAVSIKLDPDGTIDVSWGGNQIFNNLQTPFTPICSPKFVLSGRTGGATDNHWVDDLSINATLHAGAPVICAEPIDVPAQLGLSATFSVSASGAEPLSYQWTKNGGDIAGANSSSYTTPPVTDADNNSLFAVRISNASGQVTSRSARLTIVRCAGLFIDFNGALPSGAYIPAGPAADPNEARVDGGYLKLTANANSAGGIFYVDDPNSGFPIEKFRMSFNAYVFGSTCCGATPADGFSVNLSQAPTPNPAYGQPAEEGVADGLAVTFDTWDNGAEDLGIDVKWMGARVPGSFRAVQVSQSPSGAATPEAAMKEVIIKLDPDGTIDVSYGGTQYLDNFQTPYQPITGGKFVFGARTGGANDNHWIDDLCITTFTAGPPFITQQPTSVTISEGRTATFTAEADGSPTLQLQWLRNGVAIPGANTASYTTPPAPVSENGAKFSLRVSNSLGTTVSQEATLTVNADNTPPTLVSAASDSKLKTVTVVFSEPVRPEGAGDNFNFSLDNGANVDGAVQTSPTTVVLTTSALVPGTVYTLTVNNIQDLAHPGSEGNFIAANSTITFKTPAFSIGYLRKEYYLNITGGLTELKAAPKFVNGQPDQVCYINSAEFNTFDEYENYGGRMEGFFVPAESGPHKFFWSSDDAGELYLSTDADPANKALIASEAIWSGRREWATSGGASDLSRKQSAVIELSAGQRYYVEGIFKEGGGGDNAAFAVKGPTELAISADPPPNGSAPVPGTMLGVFASEAGTTLTITQNPANATVDENMSATFTVAATSTGVPTCANGGAAVTYQWQKDGVNIPGATGASYSTGPAPRTDNGAIYRAIVRIPGREAVSSDAVLTVNPDLVPPTIVTATGNAAFDAVIVKFNELMQEADVEDNFNFSIDNGILVTGTEMASDGMTVRLTLDPTTPLVENTLYKLTVINVRDLVGNPIVDGEKEFRSFVVGCPAKVIFEAYPTGGGTSIPELTGHPSYPNSPDARGEIATFNSRLFYPGDGRENYGGRMRGYFFAPETGAHTFYVAADDNAELWLSTDINPANKVRIARESAWSAHREWTASSGSSDVNAKRSAPINLIAGQAYYLEVIYKEGGGGDHAAVAVQLPGQPAPANGANEIDPKYLGAIAGAGSIGQLVIEQQPVDTTVLQNRTATFTARGAAPAGTDPQLAAVCYQWLLNGVEIPGATSATYTTPVTQVSDSGNRYSVRIAIIGDKEVSQEAVLTVTPDTTAPKLLSASGRSTLTHVLLTFDELMDPGTGADGFNYSIPGLTIVSATVNGSNIIVETSAQTPGASYTVTVANVTDAAGNPIAGNNTATFQAWVLASGFATRDFFFGIGGVIPGDLTANPKYPNSPDRSEPALNLESPLNFQDGNHGDVLNDYGTRVHGWIRPPASGNWNFAMSADDGAELWLSTDENPANAVKIATEPTWNGVRDFTGTARRNAAAPENRSTSLFPAGIPLVAGQRYWFQAIMKEGGGGDNLSVTWQQVGDVLVPSSANSPGGEQAVNATDNSSSSKYLNFDKLNTGFTVTPAAGSTVVTALRFTTANDAPERDPMDFVLEGTTGDPAVGPWTVIGSGATGLSTERFAASAIVPVANATPYTSYRITFPTVRNAGAANSMQIAEVEFLNASGVDVTRPGSIVNGQATISGIHLQTLVPPGDVTAPTLVNAVRDGTQQKVSVVFSEIVERDSANTAGNYSISGGSVTGASLQGDGKTVVLNVTGVANGPCQTISVSGVKDSVGNTIAAASSVNLIKTGAHLASGAQNLIVVEAENFDLAYTPPQGATPNGWTVGSSLAGASGGRYMELFPNNNTFYGDDSRQYYGSSPRLDYSVNFPVAGTYFIYVRGDTQNDGGNNSLHMGLDGSSESPTHRGIGDGTQNWGSPWGWVRGSFSGNARITVPTAGYHTVNIYAREDGLRIDKFLLTTDGNFAAPADAGPASSAREAATPLPVAAITEPAEGRVFEACSPATIRATASVECAGTIARVIFLANGSPIGQDTTAPYELTIPNAPSGSFALVAVAEDTLGRQGPSAPVNVTVKNTAPSFTAGAGHTSAEDAGAQSVPGFATGMSAGTPCEAGQALTFVLTSDNPSLFAAGPAIASNGTLSYTAAPDASGVANVTAVLRDDGGTAAGGQDTSAPRTFVITVTGGNDCPSSANQAVTTLEDTAATINLGPASDPDGQTVTYSVTAGPAHGSVSLAGNIATYTPAANYCGTDSFKYALTDGVCPRVEYTVSITVTCVNDAPAVTVRVDPSDCGITFANQSGLYLISLNGDDANVVLTAAATDAEGDSLTYSWTDEDGNVIGTTPTISMTFPVGCHTVKVRVSDGTSTTEATLSFCIITVSEAIEQCVTLVDNAQIDRKNKRPFIASLKAAGASADRGSLNSCIGQLGAFQNKVRAQVSKSNPAEGQAIIDCAENILKAIRCAADHAPGQ